MNHRSRRSIAIIVRLLKPSYYNSVHNNDAVLVGLLDFIRQCSGSIRKLTFLSGISYLPLSWPAKIGQQSIEDFSVIIRCYALCSNFASDAFGRPFFEPLCLLAVVCFDKC